jgi:hypothetical protein
MVQFCPHDSVVVHRTWPLPASHVSPEHDTDRVEFSQPTEQCAASAEGVIVNIKAISNTNPTLRISYFLISISVFASAAPTAEQLIDLVVDLAPRKARLRPKMSGCCCDAMM